MARKNTLFSVDIKKENPLITIIKNGKIPIVQITDNSPFYNKNVEYWYSEYQGQSEESKEIYNAVKENLKKHNLTNFTYFNIGGFHGRDFSHWHCGNMPIHIGYIEPDEIVYDRTSRAFVTAKRKLESIKNAWNSLLKNEKEEDIMFGKWSYFNEHFANFQDVYGDSKHIKKVLTIPVEEYINILPYVNDGYLSLNCIDDIFADSELSSEFLEHIDTPNLEKEWELKIDRDCAEACPPIVYEYTHDFMEHDSRFYRMLLEEFYSYYINHTFKYTTSFWKNYKIKFNEFIDYLNNYVPKNQDVFIRKSYSVNASMNHIRVEFNNIVFYLEENNFRFFKSWDNEISIDKIFSDEIRYPIYEFITIVDKYYDTLKEYTNIQYPEIFHKLKKFRELEYVLRFNNFKYTFKDEEYLIEMDMSNEKSKIVVTYNFQLNDFIIQVDDEYFNKDKMHYFSGSSNVNTLLEIVESCMK